MWDGTVPLALKSPFNGAWASLLAVKVKINICIYAVLLSLLVPEMPSIKDRWTLKIICICRFVFNSGSHGGTKITAFWQITTFHLAYGNKHVR
jgi:hypothetical protein